MDERSGWQTLQSVMMGGSWFVNIACQIALIVVVATVVRRHRPDAWRSLLAWAITAAAAVVLLPALHYLLLTVGRSGDGITSFYKITVINQAIGIPVDLVVYLLLIRGLVRIAQPAPKPEIGPTPPYR